MPFNYTYANYIDIGLLVDILNSGDNCMNILNSIEVTHLLNTTSVYVDLSDVNGNNFPFDAPEFYVLLCKGNPDVSLCENLTRLSLMLSNANFERGMDAGIYLTLTYGNRAIFLLYSIGSMDSMFFPNNLPMHKDLWAMSIDAQGIGVKAIPNTPNSSIDSISIAKDGNPNRA